MEDFNLYPIEVDTFREWLCAAPQPGAIVGVSTDDTNCPLSNFLQSNYGCRFAVHLTDYERLSDDLLYGLVDTWNLPEWAETFVRRLDFSTGCLREPVTYERALTLLDEACVFAGVELEG